MVYDQDNKIYGPLYVQNGKQQDALLIEEKESADDFCKHFNKTHDPKQCQDAPIKYRGFTAKPIEKK